MSIQTGKTCHSTAIGEHNKKEILETNMNVQKQSLEIFYKKSCSKNFCNVHRKKPELECLFSKVVPTRVFSCEHCKIFKNTCFEGHLGIAAS